MRSYGVLASQAKRFVMAVALLMATIIPALVPAIVAAAQVTERSVALSSSSAGATNVSYTVGFKSVEAAGAVVVDFCTNTPLYGEACTAPTGFNVGTLSAVPSGFTAIGKVTSNNNNTLRITGTIAADTTISAQVTGITNPTNAGPLYARIVTFDTEANANAYVPDGTNTGMVDNGGVALSITPTVGVSGAVLESMTFCVSGESIGPNCVGTGAAAPALTPPTVKLGTTVGDVTVLDSNDTYEGTVNTQISTNAVSGATVYLKSNTLGCGGLARAGAASFAAGCGIGPALAAGINDGDALFGVKTGTAAQAVGAPNPNGTVRAYDNGGGAYYNSTTFKMNWVSGDASGVTSPYGDPFLDTDGAPVNDMGMPITFGASAANDTPAGRYSAELSLIATGKF